MSAFVKMVRGRLWRRNKNWVCMIYGEAGSGKSYTAMRIAEMVDKKFSVDNVVFNTLQLFELLNSEKLKRGSVIIYDEAGVGFGARDYYKDQNKRMSNLLQTFRAFNFGLIITVPNFSFIDVHGRKLIHTTLETQSINIKEQYVRLKWKTIKIDPVRGEPRGIFPRIKDENGVTTVRRFIKIIKPSPKLVKEYENMKKIFLKTLVKESLDHLKSNQQREEYFKDKYAPKDPNFVCKNGHQWHYKGHKVKPQCPKCARTASPITDHPTL